MTPEKLKSVFANYKGHLDNRHPLVSVLSMEDGWTVVSSSGLGEATRIAHYKYMCDKAVEFVDEGRIEKAMRWLGFLQGALWKEGHFTLDQLKRHSMPDPDEDSGRCPARLGDSQCMQQEGHRGPHGVSMGFTTVR